MFFVLLVLVIGGTSSPIGLSIVYTAKESPDRTRTKTGRKYDDRFFLLF